MPDILQDIKDNLPERNSRILPAQGANAIPHLMIDIAGLELVIAQISTAQQVSDGEPMREGVDVLQMYAQLSFEMNSTYYDETSMLLSDINSRLPLLGFIANAGDRRVAFRYMHMFDPDKPNYTLIDEALEMIEFAVSIFGDYIQAVATGDKSYEVVMETLPR